MAIRLPTDLNNKWTQPNSSDKLGSLWMTKNINLDEEGYIKLSPRTVRVMSDDATEGGDANFNLPLAFGRYSSGNFQIVTNDESFNADFGQTTGSFSQNTGTNNPSHTSDSHGCWFNSLWHATTATTVVSKAVNGSSSATWTDRVTGLTSGVRHYVTEFASERTLCVTDGNVVRQYDTSYSTSGITQLTISSDYEAVGLAYNNGLLGVITKLGSDSGTGRNLEAKLYIWDGNSNSAKGYGVGSDVCIAIAAFKSSFIVLTRSGQWKYFNGGGFEDLAALPFYYQDKVWGSPTNFITHGDSTIFDGDIAYTNVGLELNSFGTKLEQNLINSPSGIWCVDQNVGAYHRWSPSISQAYLFTVLDSAVDTGTDTLTVLSGTVPATGSLARMTFSTNGIGGLATFTDYYIIKTASGAFRLATTKDNALAGVYIDITSAGSGSSSYFWVYDLKDFSTTTYSTGDAGAITLLGNTENYIYQDVMFGAQIRNASNTDKYGLYFAVPNMEARGYFVTPKVFSGEETSINRSLVVKFRPLGASDSIIVKSRSRDIFGLPVTTPNGSGDLATWTSPNEFYTTADLSEAKTYLDGGNELEIEFIAGAGGGVMTKITEINQSGGTYALVLAEDVLGAAAGNKSHFVINNWEVKRVITSQDADIIDNIAYVPIGGSGKFIQFKIELRGCDVTIEEIGFSNQAQISK